MAKLRIETILEYYDQPQLFVARDSFDTLYLCLLYDDEILPEYTAIRISQNRMNDFLNGNEDLRDVFQNPESKGEFFNVTLKDGEYTIETLKGNKISEERLPDRGYRIPNTANESITVSVPIKGKHSINYPIGD